MSSVLLLIHRRFIFIMCGQASVHGRPNSDFYVCTVVTCSYQVRFKALAKLLQRISG